MENPELVGELRITPAKSEVIAPDGKITTINPTAIVVEFDDGSTADIVELIRKYRPDLF